MAEEDVLHDSTKMVNECMEAAIQETNPDKSINKFLEAAGKGIKATRLQIYKVNEDGTFSCLYEWDSDPSLRVFDLMQNIHRDDYYPSAWWDNFYVRQLNVIDSTEPYKNSDPAAYENLCRLKIHSIVTTPIIIEEKLTGFVMFINPDPAFMQGDTQLYILGTSFIAMMLRHKDNVQRIYEHDRIDRLTGLYSMNAFRKAVDSLVTMVRDGLAGTVYDVVFLDVAGFKVLNSEKGYNAGDELLKKIALLLKDVLGKDEIARFEADHFYLVIEDEKAESFINVVHERCNKELGTILRAGIYTITGKETGAIQCADRAMMAGDSAKGDFHRYVKRYEPQMEVQLQKNSWIVSHLDEALANGWLKVFYQPIVNPFNNSVVFTEALSRWQDPVHGMLSPAAFIPALESNKLLYKVDLFVIDHTCAGLSIMRKAGHECPKVTVNLSRNDLEVEGMHESINAILDGYGIPHERIVIEITESAIIENEESIAGHVARFHEDGYQVWLDDFGSGMSSLNALQSFDFDCIKIDMQFLRHANQKTTAILSDIVDLGKRLGMSVLIEGVETQEQAEFASKLGIFLHQGYWYMKPVDEMELYPDMEKRGLHLVDEGERRMLRTIERLNMLDPLHAQFNGSYLPRRSSYAISIILKDENGQKTIYTNEAYEEWMHFMGISTIEQMDEIADDETSLIGSQAHGMLRQMMEKGSDEQVFNLEQNMHVKRVRVHIIARNGSTIACMFVFPGIMLS